jgi:hypothetical protein
MRNYKSIRAVVRKALSRHFTNVRIVDVRIEEGGRDLDSDEVLRISIIFEGQGLDPRKLAGAIRHLRPELDSISETAFPLLSFIPKAEIDKEKRARA